MLFFCFLGSFLTFEWTQGRHTVCEFGNKEQYERCDFNGINCFFNSETAPPTKTLTYPYTAEGFKPREEPHYFMCPVDNHCNAGMKLKVFVKEICD